MPDTIRAAGGVVWRVAGGRTEIAVVHRDRYDDWSLPKGKLEDGEAELGAAVREVREELGAEVVVSRRLRRLAYPVDGATKTVAYWLMQHVGGDFVANDEVDEVRWVPLDEAASLLSYDTERDVLDDVAAVPLPDATVVIVRHAKAGKRSEWHGDDALRPLDETGVGQAQRLVTFLAAFRPDRVRSAPPERCVRTVAPFAQAHALEVVVDPRFGDDDHAAAPKQSEAALLEQLQPGHRTVVSSQGATIPALIEAFAPWVRSAATKKGAAWVLTAVDGTVVSADAYPNAAR